MKLIRSMVLILCISALLCVFAGCDTGVVVEPDNSDITESETNKSTTPKATSPTIKYDEEAPEIAAEIPKYNGKEFDFSNINVGQKSQMHVIKVTTADEYKAYLTELEKAGYSFYTDNTIGDNLYATYENDTHIVNVMFISAYEQVRVIVDEKSVFSLPGLEEENIYESTSDPSLTLLSDQAVRWPGRMGYVYKLADGSFFIIDGGYTKIGDHGNSSSEYLMAVLDKYADDPNNIRISGWFITHVHEDHFGAFLDMSRDKELLKRITIEKFIYNSPSEKDLSEQSSNGSGLVSWGRLLEKAIAAWKPEAVIKAHPGQEFYIKNLKMTVYHSHELLLYSRMTLNSANNLRRDISVHNNTSVVTKVDFMGKTTLYMADSSAISNQYVLSPVYNKSLECDILQVAHHGYGDTAAGSVYQHISPQMVFWPVCKGHYDGKNNDGSIYYENGKEYSGVINVGFNIQYLNGEDVVHYYHGEECITFEDFETWEGIRWDAVPEEDEKTTDTNEENNNEEIA